MEPVYTESIGNYTISIFPDEDFDSSFLQDESFLVAFHRDFYVPQEGYTEELLESIVLRDGQYEDGSVNDEAVEVMRQYHVLPIEAYIHSGVRLALANEGSFPDRQWDVSLVGAAFIPKEISKRISGARKMAQGFISTWNLVLEGSVFGYVVERDGEHIESCWGFIEEDLEDSDIVRQARSDVEHDRSHRMIEHCNRRKKQIRNRAPLYVRETISV